MVSEKPEKLLDILKVSTDFLKQKGIEEARLNAELMLCEILKYERIDLYLNFERPLSNEEKQIFRSFLKRRINKEPLQYIIGKTNFYGYTFLVNKNVLIPRPETEYLVERSISLIKEIGFDRVRVLEIGTGSGCISISLAKELDKIISSFEIDAVDSSEKAIELAIRNADLNNINKGNLNFKVVDVFKDNLNLEFYNIVLSNPPYIPYSEYNNLPEEIKLYEPPDALTDFEDGLKYYRKIFELFKQSKNNCSCILEIGYNQRNILENVLNLYKIKNYYFEKDLNNHFRYLILNK